MSIDKQYRAVGENQFLQDAMDAVTDKVLAFKPRKKKVSLPTDDKSAGGQSPHQSDYPAES